MRMLKYKCLLCGRIHYGREDLKAGYCTTCGPKGRLIYIVNWDRVSKSMTVCIERATESIRNLGRAMTEVSERKII